MRFTYSYFGINGFLILLASLFAMTLSAQECPNIPPATNNCEEAPILCEIDEIDGYCTVTKPDNNYMAPNPLCPQGGAPHNPFWFAFYAGCTDLELFLVPKNCGGPGIQAAIYGYGGDGLCTNSQEQPAEFIACATIPCFNTPMTFMANNLTVGQIYYFMIDGCSGDTCTIDIFVMSKCGAPDIGPWPGQIQGPTPICAGGTATYSVAPPVGGTIFHWYLDGSNIQEGGDNEVNITWPGPGVYSLCVDVSNQCVSEFENPVQICKDITVYEIVPVDPPPVTICATDTYTYNGSDYPPGVHEVTLQHGPYSCDSVINLTVNGFVVTNAVDPEPVLICEDATYTFAGNDYPPGSHQVVLKNYLNCDSIVTLLVNPDPHVAENLGTFYMCSSDTIRVGGQLFYGDPPGYKQVTISKVAEPKCDSTIIFDIETMWVEPYIFPPDVLGCFIEEALLDAGGSVFNPLDGTLSYQWFALDGGELGDPADGPTMWVNTPGKYCVQIIIESPDGQYSCSDSTCVTVTSLPIPQASATVDGIVTCANPQVNLTGSSQTPNVTFQWINPQGNVISNTTTATASTPGIYRFVVTDNTGCPTTAAVNVLANQTPPDLSASGDTITCAVPAVDLEGASQTPGVTYTWKNSLGEIIGNAPVIPAPGPGNFTFLVFNPVNGCADSLVLNIPIDQTAPIPQASTDTLTCLLPQPPLQGGSNLPGAVYTWRFAGNVYASQPDTVASQSGAYTLTVFNPVNGCSRDTTIIVPEDTVLPDAQAAGDSLDCIKTIATLVGSSATPGATFRWFDSNQEIGNTPSINVTLPGIYTLQVTGPNGCTNTTTTEAILDADIPDVFVNPSDDTLNCTITEIVLAGSASMSVTYSWTNVGGTVLGTNANLTVNTPGTYTLTVTAANGCSNQTSVLIPQDIVPPVIDAVSGGELDCISAGVNLGASSSTPGVVYQWYTSPGNSALPTGPAPYVTSAGTFKLIVTAYNGCVDSAFAVVTASPDLPQDVVATNTGPINCSNASVNINIGSSTPGVVYQWQGPGYNGTGQTSPVTLPGVYNVTVTNPLNGCTQSTFTTVGIDTIHPVLTPNGNLINCFNPNVNISVVSVPASGVSYQWSNPSGTPSGNTATISAGVSGNWQVTVTNTTNGCARTVVVPVTENTTAPTITIPAVALLTCTNPASTIQNTASTTVNYQWSGPGISGANQTVATPNINLPGTYQVTITDPVNGCTGTGSIAVVEDRVDPVVTLSGGNLDCNDPSITITGSATPNTGIAVQWLLNGNPVGGTGTNLPVNQSGTYTLVVTNTVNGCVSQAEAQVTENFDVPNVTATGGELTCLAPTLSIVGTSTTPGVTYQWTGPGGFTAANAVTQVTIPGAYLLTVTAPNGCTNQATSPVTEDKDLPTAVASTSNIIDCSNPTTTLSAAGSSSGAGFSYAWTGPTGGLVGTSFTASGIAAPGVYTLTVSNAANGCSHTTTVVVADNQNLPTGLDIALQDPRCFGNRDGSMIISGVTGGTPPFLYSLNGGPFTPNGQFSGLGDGSYTITVQDAAGCLYTAPAFVLTEPLQLTVELDEDFILQWGRDTFVFALISPPNALIESIQWTPAGVDTTQNAREINIQPFNQTLYGVVVTDAAGCRAEDKVLVLVEKRRPVYIPNAFAPSGAQNTRFYIQSGEGIEEVEVFEVFNRWGERVFRRENFQPNDPSLGWDGNIRDRPANPEVFVYYAKIRFNDGITILYKGDVTLMR